MEQQLDTSDPEVDPATDSAPGSAPDPVAGHAIDRGVDELGDAEADLQVAVAELETLFDEIDLALRRLEDGTYGTCQHCGEPIADLRLADDPTVATCERHPQLAEQDRAEPDSTEQAPDS